MVGKYRDIFENIKNIENIMLFSLENIMILSLSLIYIIDIFVPILAVEQNLGGNFLVKTGTNPYS